MPPTSPLDVRLFLDLYGGEHAAFTWLALGLSAVGGGWAVLGLVPFLAVARWRTLMAWLSGTLAVSALLVFLLKLVVGRARPCASLAGVHALCAAPTDPSFPSGHACGSFTFAAFVVWALWEELRERPGRRALIVVVLGSLASAVAWSRVYLGVHFPGDVAAGAVLGVVLGGLGGERFRARRVS